MIELTCPFAVHAHESFERPGMSPAEGLEPKKKPTCAPLTSVALLHLNAHLQTPELKWIGVDVATKMDPSPPTMDPTLARRSTDIAEPKEGNLERSNSDLTAAKLPCCFCTHASTGLLNAT